LSAAHDRVGHVTEVTSQHVIVDSTPPSIDYVGAGETIDEVYISGQELSVFWRGVKDNESGILKMEVNKR
jgi:hypothetical protein